VATATQSLQPSQPDKKLFLVLDKEPWMEEWARTRGCKTVTHWLEQLIDAEHVAQRLYELNWFRGGTSLPPEGESVSLEANTRHGAPRALPPEQEDELWELYEIGAMNAPALAERFHVGISTVRRILKAREERDGGRHG